MENESLKINEGESPQKNKWEFLSNLHPLLIVFFIIVALSISTYIIPGGAYDRYEVAIDALNGDTRELIKPDSFHYIESVPQGFHSYGLLLWKALLKHLT